MTSAHEQHPDLTPDPTLPTPDPVIDLDDALLSTEGWDADADADLGQPDYTTDDTIDDTTGDYDLAERHALRRVAGLSTELEDVTEVEYRQLRLERVVLVGVWTEGTVQDAENSMAELALLAETAGSTVLDAFYQRRQSPDPATYIGRGKVDGLREIVQATGADTVILDGELAPSQLRNLEDRVKVKVVDRTALILDIFAQHARSREGQAQVELAQLSYMKQRLRGWGATCPDRPVDASARREAASAAVAPARPRSRRTVAGSTPRSPSCAASSRTCAPPATPSAPTGSGTRSRRSRSPATPTRASPRCSTG